MATTTDTAAAVKPAAKKAAKPRPKPCRSVSLVEPATPESDGWMAVRLTVGKECNVYLVRPLPCDIEGAAYEVEKLDDTLNTLESYHVRLADRETSCTCPGHTYHCHCKHAEGLAALAAKGLLPRLLVRAKEVQCPRCADVDTDRAPGICAGCTAEDDYYDARTQADEMEAAGIDPWESPVADDTYTTIPSDCPF